MRSTSTRSSPIYLLRPSRHLSRASTVCTEKVQKSLAVKKALYKRVPFSEAMYLSSFLPFRNMYLLRAALQRYSSCTRHLDSRFLACMWVHMDPFKGPVVEQEAPHQRARRYASHNFAALSDTCGSVHSASKSQWERSAELHACSRAALCFILSACTNIVRCKVVTKE